jgi:membrane protease YdiL (CAAX protease family)
MLVAGIAQETVFRGFLFERLGRVLGSSAGARVAIVVLTSALFGASHWESQGLAGVQQATLVGMVYGGIFAVTGRIWMPAIVHTAFILTALAIIFWDLETTVARLIFK